jgi:type I restriction-modification system DNA methylase subunit
MWISYNSSEVNEFHPICEKALISALKILKKDDEYRVLHHQCTGSLQMDYVVQNTSTGKYLCVFEVKRTPSDVNSARYQYQAMSYVQMNLPVSEKPYYVLTNLEYSYVFRYDANRSRVFQQMLAPGLLSVGRFDEIDQDIFESQLANQFANFLKMFLEDNYNYLLTFEQFETHMRNISQNSKQWKSSLAILLYEYIRGAFCAIGRCDLQHDVRAFHNNIERICTEATRINFKEIFAFNERSYEKNINIGNEILTNIFDLGKQTISGDSVADLLHEIASTGMEHQGEVPTDLELARVIAVLAKNISGKIAQEENIFDPAAGSGNLLTSALDVYNISPRQIKANDVNIKLLELLSLRLGLSFPQVIRKNNSAKITTKDITLFERSDFENTKVILLNPPFVAGINCVKRKIPFFERIKDLTCNNAITDVGQMGLEGVFLELICSLCHDKTTIACVLPTTHLTARGAEAKAIRKLLLYKMNINTVFIYPEDGLFEEVTKGTCVVLGKKGKIVDRVSILVSNTPVANLDLHRLETVLDHQLSTTTFDSLMPGLDGIAEPITNFESQITDGWRKTSRERLDTLNFITRNIASSGKLQKISEMAHDRIKRKRGSAGSSGGSDLIFLDRNKPLYQDNSNYKTLPAMRNAKIEKMLVGNGDSAFFDVLNMKDNDISAIIEKFMNMPTRHSRQPRASKSATEYKRILKKEAKKIFHRNSVLIPRAIRTEGKAYLIDRETIVSTNFLVCSFPSYNEAAITVSWINTIFYQMICEFNAKPQEGMRKMEVADIESTYVPKVEMLTDAEKRDILDELPNIEFFKLNKPIVRNIDLIWSKILYGKDADKKIDEAKRLLEFLANTRNH